MREADYVFNEGLMKGLRKFDPGIRNQQTLVRCQNWAPEEQGLEAHEKITLIVVGNTYDQTP